MLEVREEDIDRITELFYRVLKGELPGPLDLPKDYPENEVRQVVEYANRFVQEYQALAGAMSDLSRGNLDLDVPDGRTDVLQSFKNLHANLRHLTWKTQQIAGGDLSQHVDFMGDFSAAFNSMTIQLREAFAMIERQNEDLFRANERMKRDLDAAAQVQQSLLPTSSPDTSRAKFSWEYLPCDELAGDFLNVFALDDQHIAVFVVDVSGHGVAASLLSVTIGRLLTPQVSTSSLLVQEQEGTDEPRIVPPAELACELNRRFPMEEQNGLYFTMLYGVLNLETFEFRFVSAGHDPIVHVPRSVAPRMVKGDGVAIGWVDDWEYDDHVIKLQPGDRLYLYSDGVPEAMDEDLNQFTMKQMMEIIELGQSCALDDSVSLLLKSVKRWCAKNGPKDDVSILGLEICGES